MPPAGDPLVPRGCNLQNGSGVAHGGPFMNVSVPCGSADIGRYPGEALAPDQPLDALGSLKSDDAIDNRS